MAEKTGYPTPPPGEIVWVSHYNKEHDLRYIITSKPARESYSLYELRDGEFVRWGRGQDPRSLADRYEKALGADRLQQEAEQMNQRFLTEKAPEPEEEDQLEL